MNRKLSLMALTLVLLCSSFAFVGITTAHGAKRAHDMVVATIWGPESVDPAWFYDTASAAVADNCYDTLIRFKIDRTRDSVMDWGRTDEFEPSLATEWVAMASPHPDAPDYTVSTYYFKIKEGVPYHDPTYGYVTPADAEYSFERWLAFDRAGGATVLFYEPILDMYHANWSNPEMPAMIDHAIESNTTHVWFNLKKVWPPMIFMQIVAQSWASVYSNEWAYEHGCWPGEAHPELNPYTNETMFAYYDPAISPLDDWPTGTGERVECGSGPYQLDHFDAIGEWYRLTWFSDYFQGWSAPGCNEYGYGGASGYAEGFMKTVTVKGIAEWGTRKSMFLAGDADFCYVPGIHVPELITNWVATGDPPWEDEEYPPGITCLPGIPSMTLRNFFFNFKIVTEGNLHIGTGDYSETGIPGDFFNDIHVRRAFAYCFNYTRHLLEVRLGEGYLLSSPQIQGNAYWEYLWDTNPDGTYPADPANVDLDPPDTVKPGPWQQPAMPNGTVLPPTPRYYKDLAKAEAEFKLAHDGTLWDTGFTFDILYNTGNVEREIAAKMMGEAAESLNPKFHLGAMEVDWPTFLGDLVAGRLTCFIIGWLADYPDPHNWFFPYLHSVGDFSGYSSYANPEVDALIERGIMATDDDERIGIYWQLGNLCFDDAPNLPISQPTGRHWERDWMQGWYNNPIYPGSYYYHLWKGYAGDVNRDYVVDIFDLVTVASAYGTSPGDDEWDAAADVNGDGTVDIFDLVIVAGQYG